MNSKTQEVKKFAEEAGVSFSKLIQLQNSPNKRQTRQKRQSHPETESKTIPSTLQSTSQANSNTSCLSTIHQPKHKKQQLNSPSNSQQTRPQRNLPTLAKSCQQLPTIPNSVDQFFQSYHSFCEKIFKPNSKQFKFIEQYKSELFYLLTVTIKQGGIVKIVAQGEKEQVFNQFVSKFDCESPEQIFKLYKKYLLHFEYHLIENYSFRHYHDPTNIFEEATFVEEQDLREFLSKTPLDPKYFEYDILVFKNGQNVINIDSNRISLDKVAEHYKSYNVDIRIQKAMDYGFRPKTMRNEPYQMKVGLYRQYQKLCEQYHKQAKPLDDDFIQRLGTLKDLDVNGTSFKERIRNEEILFAVNFDPDDGILFDHIQETVKGTFLGYKEEFDLLSYLDHEVPGCTFPQFYFKVKGVWTGGHQENLNMCAVNINHGPDASQWYTMDFKYVEDFRAQLKKEHKMDLYGSEGLWYEKLNWFLEDGKYPVKKIIQKKGDIVISGPGTLHWVRSHGIALQSAWNQFPITYNSLYFAYHRQEENERIRFAKSNVIPLKVLTLKFLNHQSKLITPQIRSLCLEKLKSWYGKQQTLFEEMCDEDGFAQDDPRNQKLDDLQGFCSKCNQQILIYFVNGKNLEDIVCLSCYAKQFKHRKHSKRVYFRHSLYGLDKLIENTESCQSFIEISQFCNGPYVGRIATGCNCARNIQILQKEADFIEKINSINQELNKCDSEQLKANMEKIKQKRIEESLQEKEEKKEEDGKQTKMQTIEEERNEETMNIEQKNNNQRDKQALQRLSRSNTVYQNVTYIGKHPNPSGWWDFLIPDHLKIVTQHNYQELLKLIDRQDHEVFKKARRDKLERPPRRYFIRFNPNVQLQNRSNPVKSANEAYFEKGNQPVFSSDQEDQGEKIRKKVRMNENEQNENQKVSAKIIRNQAALISQEMHAKYQPSEKNLSKNDQKSIKLRSRSKSKQKRRSRSNSSQPQCSNDGRGKRSYNQRGIHNNRQRSHSRQRKNEQNDNSLSTKRKYFDKHERGNHDDRKQGESERDRNRENKNERKQSNRNDRNYEKNNDDRNADRNYNRNNNQQFRRGYSSHYSRNDSSSRFTSNRSRGNYQDRHNDDRNNFSNKQQFSNQSQSDRGDKNKEFSQTKKSTYEGDY